MGPSAHFTDEETETQGGEDLLVVTQLDAVDSGLCWDPTAGSSISLTPHLQKKEAS